MYAATRGPNVKWGEHILNGGPSTTGPCWRRSCRDPQVGSRNVILGSRNQLAWQIRHNNFCKFYKKIVLYAVSCLLWCLPELSNDDKKQAQVMHCYTMIALTYWPILTLLHSFRHEGMLLLRPKVPKLGYMYPLGCIYLSEGVHLRLAIEEKNIFT